MRAPSEFSKGHIPGATNLPLFDDEERARVGITYKEKGRRKAIAVGLEIVGKKADALLDGLSQFETGQPVFLHCWRGGMRSEGFAWLAMRSGLEVQRIAGGYKAFRHAAHASFAEPRRIIILSGFTGAGKTVLLETIRQAGEKVIDLEALANHRGSAFGGIGQPAQPTVEQFENNLFDQWRNLNPDELVWIEGESQSIGRAQVPEAVWRQMCAAPTIFVEADRESRIQFLMGEYGSLPKDDLAEAIGRVKKRLGGLRYQQAIDALATDNVAEFAGIALDYYDSAYGKALQKRPRAKSESVSLKAAGVAKSVEELIRLGRELTTP